ncbi:MAG: hypothetical protein MUE63_04405 [Xanthomonadales bacterium]|nr:hypothetical protein [Xanthomonadales bacterium]
MNPAATDHLPVFVTQPGDTDVLLVGTAIFLLLFIIGIGLVYWRLHALPEQMAHRGEKIQYQFVAVLGLLSLLTHNHAFWVAGLLLAFVRLPDFSTPLTTMARSLSKMAGLPDPGEAQQPKEHAETAAHAHSPAAKPESPEPPPGPQGPHEVHGG